MQDISKYEKTKNEEFQNEKDYYDEENYEDDDDYYSEDDYEQEDDYQEEVTRKDIRNQEDLIVQDMADFLKLFGDYSRIKILECIIDLKYTVGDISVFTGLSYSAVSHHLKILQQAKLVVSEKSGKYVYYIVADRHVEELYNLARAHIEEFQKTILPKEEHDELARIFQEKIDSGKLK